MKVLPEESNFSYNTHKKHKEFISRINDSAEHNETTNNMSTQYDKKYFKEGEGKNNGNSR